MGATTIILACRSLDKGQQVVTRISKADTELLVWQVDLDCHASVISFCQRAKNLPRLDGIVLNAGIELVEYEQSEGLERTLTVNVVSTYLMALSLLPKLQESAASHKTETHMTIVGSLIHIFGPHAQLEVSGSILDSLSDAKTADMMQRYNLSKLMVHMCYIELVKSAEIAASRSHVIINLVNPGWCGTELSRNRNSSVFERIMFSLIGRTAEEGSRPLVHGVVASKDTHGKYLSECKVKDQSTFLSSEAGQRLAEKLWKEVSHRIARIHLIV